MHILQIIAFSVFEMTMSSSPHSKPVSAVDGDTGKLFFGASQIFIYLDDCELVDKNSPEMGFFMRLCPLYSRLNKATDDILMFSIICFFFCLMHTGNSIGIDMNRRNMRTSTSTSVCVSAGYEGYQKQI